MKRAAWLLLAGLLLPAPALAQEIATDTCATGGDCDPLKTDVDPDRDPTALERRRGFSSKLSAGFAYRNLYGIPILAADLQLALGAATRRGSFYGTLGAMLGDTQYGLPVRQIVIGGAYEGAVSKRIRLGVEPRVTYIAITRATSGHAMSDLGLGVHVAGSVDLFHVGWFVMHLGARAGLDVFPGGDSPTTPLLLGATAFAGFRY